jgi:hypothetical protein
MRPLVVAPFTLYCEEYAQELVGQVDGHVTRLWGETVPLGVFLNDVWQSAKREGYIEGHVQAQSAHYADVYGYEPTTSVIGDWRKQSGRKAMWGEDDISFYVVAGNRVL